MLLGATEATASPYTAYCVDDAIMLAGEGLQGEIDERMSERDEEGNPVNDYEWVYREVMQIELSPAEKRRARAEQEARMYARTRG